MSKFTTLKGSRNLKTKLNKSKKRKASSTRWLQRQFNDIYVQSAQSNGYYSRAAYKLLEINEKFNILKPNQKVVDLGAAPGGWSQVVSKIIKPSGTLVAVDLLEIKPIDSNAILLQGDFLDPAVMNQIITSLNGKANVILSDMAPNTTGNKDVDHIRIIHLIEIAFEFCNKVLDSNGCFVAKVFQGGTEPQLLLEIKKKFNKVKHFKPPASRKESKEIYLVAEGFKN